MATSGPGFYRGTTHEQTPFFCNKEKKMIEEKKWPECFSKRVDFSKVSLDVVKSWITRNVTQILGHEDDIVIDFIMQQLLQQPGSNTLDEDSDGIVDPKRLTVTLTGFMAEKAQGFVADLWRLLLSAQESDYGIPKEFAEAQELERQVKLKEADRIKEELAKLAAQQRAPSRSNSPGRKNRWSPQRFRRPWNSTRHRPYPDEDTSRRSPSPRNRRNNWRRSSYRRYSDDPGDGERRSPGRKESSPENRRPTFPTRGHENSPHSTRSPPRGNRSPRRRPRDINVRDISPIIRSRNESLTRGSRDRSPVRGLTNRSPLRGRSPVRDSSQPRDRKTESGRSLSVDRIPVEKRSEPRIRSPVKGPASRILRDHRSSPRPEVAISSPRGITYQNPRRSPLRSTSPRRGKSPPRERQWSPRASRSPAGYTRGRSPNRLINGRRRSPFTATIRSRGDSTSSEQRSPVRRRSLRDRSPDPSSTRTRVQSGRGPGRGRSRSPRRRLPIIRSPPRGRSPSPRNRSPTSPRRSLHRRSRSPRNSSSPDSRSLDSWHRGSNTGARGGNWRREMDEYPPPAKTSRWEEGGPEDRPVERKCYMDEEDTSRGWGLVDDIRRKV